MCVASRGTRPKIALTLHRNLTDAAVFLAVFWERNRSFVSPIDEDTQALAKLDSIF